MSEEDSDTAEHRADLAWAVSLASGDRDALARFERELVPVIAAILRARGFAGDDIAEVQQELRAHLFVGSGTGPYIAQYAGRASLRSWVLVSALRSAVKRRGKQRREPTADDDVLVALIDQRSGGGSGVDELAGFKEPIRDAFRRAFRAALAQLAPGHRILLRLHAIDGLSIDEIGALEGVHRATAARRLERARDALHMGTRAALMAELGTDRGEADSLMRWVRSQIDVSLSGLARPTDSENS